jgi:hypothetical protein
VDPLDPDPVLATWRVEEAADRRRRAARERQLLEAELRLDDLWATWASKGAAVTVHTSAGRQHRGHLTAVGADMVVLTPTAGPPVALPTEHAVGVAEDELTVAGTPAPRSATTFVEVLRELADREAEVAAVAGAATVRGRIEVLGVDVAVVRDSTGRRNYLRVEALSELSSISMTSSSW